MDKILIDFKNTLHMYKPG